MLRVLAKISHSLGFVNASVSVSTMFSSEFNGRSKRTTSTCPFSSKSANLKTSGASNKRITNDPACFRMAPNNQTMRNTHFTATTSIFSEPTDVQRDFVQRLCDTLRVFESARVARMCLSAQPPANKQPTIVLLHTGYNWVHDE